MEEYRDLDLTIAVFTRLLDQPGARTTSRPASCCRPTCPTPSPRMHAPAGVGRGAARGRRRAASRCASSRAPTSPMEQRRRRRCTTGRSPPGGTKQRHRHQLQARARLRAAPRSAPRPCGSASPATTSSTSPSPGCWPSSAASRDARRVRDAARHGARARPRPSRRDVGSLLLYTPVVHPAEFDVAIAYLIRRLEENASQENFMSAVFELATTPTLFERETRALPAPRSAELDDEVPAPNRAAGPCPARAVAARARLGFRRTTPDTDPSLAGRTATGAARILGPRRRRPTLGQRTPIDGRHASRRRRRSTPCIDTAGRDAGEAWGALLRRRAGRRSCTRAGDVLEARRARPPRGHGARDRQDDRRGRPRGQRGDRLRALLRRAAPRARPRRRRRASCPSRLTVVTPPWNFPVAIPAGSALAALAAGSAVIIKPARRRAAAAPSWSRRCGRPACRATCSRCVDLDERALGPAARSRTPPSTA